ncbi:hypothetical protein [Pseudomonas sp. BF-R-24]|uniref:hypothetical protein n=1 Tax=Pseudomonas sp. BF-R-24 TaxID=2832386 RepID=UPI001CC04A2A|nr:hypothetical protein [Pseudomonas sp. BF-R-24]
MPEEMTQDAAAADRALLILAAKAGRIEIEPCTCRDTKWPYRLAGKSGVRAHWNPLINDGDALRLAVVMGRMERLGVAIHIVEPYDGDTDPYTYVDAKRFGEHTRYHHDDPFAATCRAIVVAAAEIGRRS